MMNQAHATTGDPALAPVRRAMLIDDDDFDLRMYQRIIARSGTIAEIVTFTSAQDALDYLLDADTPHVDLIFLDINMPRMSGFEFMQAACAALGPDFDVPVVMMLTTSMSDDDRNRARTFAPIKAYFNKPLSPDHLTSAAAIATRAA